MDNKAIIFIKNLWEKTIAPSISTLIKKEKENADRIVEAIENKEIPKKMTVSLDGVSVVTLKGDKGDPGKDGRDGKDGKGGKDGRPGRDGKDGKPGKDGKDGYSNERLQCRYLVGDLWIWSRNCGRYRSRARDSQSSWLGKRQCPCYRLPRQRKFK
jgi:hypothetical protein